MGQHRPIYLNFFAMRFPITAWVSILHRLSGIVVFLFIPGLLWLLQESLASENRFVVLIGNLHHPLLKFVLFGILAALFYHLIAGIRHLLMDIHIGESKREGRVGSWLVLGLSFLMAAILGNWLW